MSYQLKLDEMQEALASIDHPQAQAFEAALCAVGNAMAAALCAALDLDCGEAEQHGIAFAGICCPFHPTYRGQPLPVALAGFDDDDAWDNAAEDLPAMNADQRARRIAFLYRECASYGDGSATPANVDAWAKGNPELADELQRLERGETPAAPVMPEVPADFPVQPLQSLDDARYAAQCGVCHRIWDDGQATAYTPAPAGRCPFEAFHP